MAKTIESDILYSNITVQIPNVPSTYEEADKLLGETGGALDGFIADCLARNYLPRLYKSVAEQIIAKDPTKSKATVATKTTTVKGEAGAPDTEKQTDVKESDIKFVGRCYTASDDAGKADITSLFHATVATLPFYAEGDRSGTGKVAAQYIEAANGIIAAGNEDAVITVIESQTPGYRVLRDSDGKATPDSLARGIAAMDKHLVAEQKRKTMALLTPAAAGE